MNSINTLQQLEEKINKQRILLARTTQRFGYSHRITVIASQHLDHLINQHHAYSNSYHFCQTT
ncbi:MAG: aspartyl-phosphate phosphatase Spo0E family protein [Bacilli bacterium]